MSWLRLCLLHRINLRRPHAGKVIFYVHLSGCDKPQPIIHPLQQVRRQQTQTHLSPSLFPPICLVFFSFLSSLPQAYPGFHQLLTNTHFIFSFSLFSLLRTEALPFSRGAPTSLKLWWMAPAPVSISKLKQFRDKTSRSLSYGFSPEFGLRWHLMSEWIREWKRGWTHKAPLPSRDRAVKASRTRSCRTDSTQSSFYARSRCGCPNTHEGREAALGDTEASMPVNT